MDGAPLRPLRQSMSPRHPPNDLHGDDSSDDYELDEDELDRFIDGMSQISLNTHHVS